MKLDFTLSTELGLGARLKIRYGCSLDAKLSMLGNHALGVTLGKKLGFGYSKHKSEICSWKLA